MGTCVGKNNFKQFVRFNMCWLAYLVYAIVWVSVLGPVTMSKPKQLQPQQEEDGVYQNNTHHL